MAKERKVSPGFTGAVSDAVDAVKDYVAKTRDQASPTGNRDEDSQMATVSGSRAAQSTDASNQY